MKASLASIILFLFCAIASATSPEELVKRQCRSVHISHGPMPTNCKAIYIEAAAEKSAPGTYFSACNFDQGYIGFQELANGNHVVIFSIWDSKPHGDNPHDVPEQDRTKLIAAGKNINTRRFGGEGTGGNSMGPFKWKLNETLKFLVLQAPSKHQGYVILSGYVFNKDHWKLISSWRTTSSPNALSRSTSFVEDFKRDYKSAKQARSGIFGPCFVLTSENKWELMNTGRFTADPTPSNNVYVDMLPERHAFRISTGGNTKTGVSMLNKTFTQPSHANSKITPPDEQVNNLIKQDIKED